MREPVDPTNATSPQMDRRTFTGLSLGAAAAGITGTFGHAHDPIVSEDDPAIVVERVKLTRPDGTIDAYAASAKAARANAPGVTVTMHIWGVDAQIRDVVRRYAKAGFSAIAPDLYSRWNPPSGDGATDISIFRPFAAKLQRSQYAGDLRAAVLYLRNKAPQGRHGITGFCMGGHLALQQTMDNADVFAAVAPFYGAVKDIDPSAVRMPVCGSYGERDTSIPADGVRAWRNALRVANDIKIYPSAGHAFFDDTRNSYVASAAEDAWDRTLTFFKEQLGLQS